MHVRFLLFYAAILMAALCTLLGFGRDVSAQGTITAALRINEFMADNESVWIDPDDPGLDEYPDWIELYNSSSQPLSLDGVFVTDDPALPAKFAITTGLTIPANGYAVFYADDEEETEGAYHLSFRLSKDSGFIGLYTGAGGETLIDKVEYGPQDADISTGRLPNGSGAFTRLTRPSPGRSNLVTSPRISDLRRTPDLPAADGPVHVSAVITDDVAVVSATIFYTVDGVGPISVSMTLADGRYGGDIPPQPDGSLVEFTLRAEDGDGQFTPDPVFELSVGGRYVVGYNIPPLVINEVLPDNFLGLEDPDDPGDYPDWIEIYNTSAQTVSLNGLYLSDNPSEPTKFAITDGLSIEPHGYLIFYADKDAEQGPLHLDFRLDRDGESLGMYGALGTVEIDAMAWDSVPRGIGYGRWPNGNGEATFMYCVTPGAANRLCDRQIYLPVVSRTE
ncbi:MAG: lamin tail domain-containing protein [Caldilineaceae bacterium]|nr:lamin tail domain-containing protein [Caldilineaceae bacterium]